MNFVCLLPFCACDIMYLQVLAAHEMYYKMYLPFFSLFPLLQLYDKHVNLSIIGYFGVVRTISLHQDQLPASPTGSRAKIEQETKSYPVWVSKLFELQYVNSVYYGVKQSYWNGMVHLCTYIHTWCMFKTQVALIRSTGIMYYGDRSRTHKQLT